MIIKNDTLQKKKFATLAKKEGKDSSEIIRKLIDNYINEHDIENYIDDLWARIGKKLSSNKITTARINNAIKEVRKEKE